MKVLLLIALCVCQAFCQPADWSFKYALQEEEQAEGKNLVELAAELRLNTLIKLLTKAGLADTIKTGGPFTIFAPTDRAFRALPKELVKELLANTTLLAGLLQYHVIAGDVYSSQLSDDLQAPSLLKFGGKQLKIRINIYSKTKVVTATGSKVSKVDQNATNGVIHVIDRVMYPIPVFDIVTLLTKVKQASTLVKAAKAAGLVKTLQSAGPFTLFAPTDAAFRKLPAGTLDALLKNKTALADILTYHVVPGTYYKAGLTTQNLKTVEGKDVRITYCPFLHKFRVNRVRVLFADMAVTNGVIHFIDSVLLPPKSVQELDAAPLDGPEQMLGLETNELL